MMGREEAALTVTSPLFLFLLHLLSGTTDSLTDTTGGSGREIK